MPLFDFRTEGIAGMGAETIRNWDGTQSWKPEAIHHPQDEDQIAGLIRQARKTNKRIKVVGEALSWSDIIDVPTIAMRFDKMADVLEVDRDRRHIRLQPGARLNDINEVLASHGLAFDNFGSIILQTAAGYTATGTHGTGARTPILSTRIKNMRLIDGRGNIRELNADHERELFSAARVNLGCLGVVSEITFSCIEAFDIEERLEVVDFNKALANLDNTIHANDYCKLWWLPSASCGGCPTTTGFRSIPIIEPPAPGRATVSPALWIAPVFRMLCLRG
jgi:L-gulonolactone oxidase